MAADVTEAAAWYEGDQQTLARLYGSPETRRRRWFWSRRGEPVIDRGLIHVPAAADIAATGADLLFGEAPELTIPDAHTETPDSDAVATEERLLDLLEVDGIASTLLEGAELCGALGGVYLRPIWDQAVADHPILTTVQADHAVPEFRWGQLTAVTFWTEVLREGVLVWRHLERHEPGAAGQPGVILHGLYVGTDRELGARQKLRALDRDLGTIRLGLDVADDGLLRLPPGIRFDVRHVPNVLPNRKHRGLPVGRADYAGTYDLMDALDETFTSWMRDIRLGKARIIVPDEFLERSGRGQGAAFNTDTEVFTPLAMDPASRESAGITAVEFALRVDEHAKTAAALFERIVVTAGYSPQTFGLTGDGSEATATEIRAKESRSVRTTQRKQRYWSTAVEDTMEMILVIDRAVFGSKVVPMRPQLQFAELGGRDIQDTASTLNLINQAQAASIDTKVRLLNPEWDEAQVSAEVERIKDEQGLGEVADPTGGFPP